MTRLSRLVTYSSVTGDPFRGETLFLYGVPQRRADTSVREEGPDERAQAQKRLHVRILPAEKLGEQRMTEYCEKVAVLQAQFVNLMLRGSSASNEPSSD